MTLRMTAIATPSLDVPMSYRALDPKKLIDSLNVTNNHGTQETRSGVKRWLTTALPGPIQSLSYFEKTTGEKIIFAKVGASLYKITTDKIAVVIKSGLNVDDKHRGITENNRHVIVCGKSGFFITDGTKFGSVGQVAPIGITSSVVNGGALTASVEYNVAVTFYASTTGYETNAFYTGSLVTTGTNKQINLATIPMSATNPFIDKIRIYTKNVTANNAFVLSVELPLGTASHSITANSLSTITVPVKNDLPLSRFPNFIAIYGDSVAVGGDENYPNEIELSEPYTPDAYDQTPTKKVIQVSGNGKITGIAVGFYNENHLDPYLIIFKSTSITIYSELSGQEVQAEIDSKIGCVCNESIATRNGIVTFMSSHGWYAIYNGQLIKDEKQIPITLGEGDIDSIFTRVGWEREINTKKFDSFFSAYFAPTTEYMTFASRAGSDVINEAYAYDESLGGFRRYSFPQSLSAACVGQDSDGANIIFLSDKSGMIYTYSTKNTRSDEDANGNVVLIEAFIIPAYIVPKDRASTYNYRLLTITAIASNDQILIQATASFNGDTAELISYDYPKTGIEFILDVSKLDMYKFGEEQTYISAFLDLCITGEALKLGFYQTKLNGNIGLISMQLQMNKNGNNNT